MTRRQAAFAAAQAAAEERDAMIALDIAMRVMRRRGLDAS